MKNNWIYVYKMRIVKIGPMIYIKNNMVNVEY